MTGIDQLDSRPGGGHYPALLGGVKMAKDPKHCRLHIPFASSDGGEYAMLTIDWLFAS